MKFRQTDEGFDWVLEGESVDEQVERLKSWAKNKSNSCAISPYGCWCREGRLETARGHARDREN